MRILSYNIHGCIGSDGVESPQRILEVIQAVDADVVCLQEVHSDDALDRNFLQQLQTLAYSAVIYGKTMRKPSADYGNVLLLREPPDQLERIELPTQGGEPRGLIIADSMIDQSRYRILATHLDIIGNERKRQVQAVLDHLPSAESETRVILLGDLNEWFPYRGYFRHFVRQFDHISAIKTFPAKRSLFALDRIALRGRAERVSFHTVYTSLARVASDHKPLICDVVWEAGARDIAR
ncbi:MULTISPECIES: endonuclease/exonuclease/phosphatase family protein [unclassified Lentimonas]|uniref:endonuclease/exonuclease/phosphatase family protein n=1 Tax=unclassified Lentimonas TaxID=2630993 RepID=UPI0013258DB9|nr:MULTISPECIES: endonuclease/exonuclease/phosphatase family protein [unclassified Lentimonas]CAA6676424.1 Unannotated [Lentimonas sp. CC4]CAA6685263.1 Unannotated [Lentimonas sp. CC6]CAA7075012.1 Unannotated [Lentimonas sp. CC4]CAA7171059.1 Unannotated [Lentimonas sp. CC21]CAA7180654.1 Unannotated [Lentimonas sp. CC8]